MNGPSPRTRRLSRRAALVGVGQAFALLAAACAGSPSGGQPGGTPDSPTLPATDLPTYTPATTPLAVQTQGPGCPGALQAVIPPTPIPYPGYTAVEPSTGLHVTAAPQVIDPVAYRLRVAGKVGRELGLTYDELRCLPKTGTYARIECPGFFVDWSNLAGAALASVLALAEPVEGAQRVEFKGIDGRTSSCALDAALGTEYFLAYEWEGEPLPASHGFPVRVALTNELGGGWVKWLVEMTVV